MLVIASAFIFTFFATIIACLLLALAGGAPWGDYAMGGKFPGKYPPFLRGLAVVQFAVIIFFAGVVLVRAELILPQYFEHAKILIWVVIVFRTMAVIANMVTSTKRVRNLWGPVSAIMLACSLIVALS